MPHTSMGKLEEGDGTGNEAYPTTSASLAQAYPSTSGPNSQEYAVVGKWEEDMCGGVVCMCLF
jgi:hypothetical protein